MKRPETLWKPQFPMAFISLLSSISVNLKSPRPSFSSTSHSRHFIHLIILLYIVSYLSLLALPLCTLCTFQRPVSGSFPGDRHASREAAGAQSVNWEDRYSLPLLALPAFLFRFVQWSIFISIEPLMLPDLLVCDGILGSLNPRQISLGSPLLTLASAGKEKWWVVAIKPKMMK